MATAPIIQYLQLDPDYDPVLDPSANLTDIYAVTQAILTRLKLFLGEWWENLKIGLPVFQSILGQLASAQGLSAMTLAVQQNIEGGPYVTGVSNISVTFTNGRLNIQAVAQTIFGVTTIDTSSPAIENTALEIQ